MTPPAPKPSVRVIEELRGLYAKAKPPPWVAGPNSPNKPESDWSIDSLTLAHSDDPNVNEVIADNFHGQRDAALIVAMHRHLPALLAVVEAAEEIRKSADVKISEYADGREYVRFDPHGVNLLGLMQSLSALDATGGWP